MTWPSIAALPQRTSRPEVLVVGMDPLGIRALTSACKDLDVTTAVDGDDMIDRLAGTSYDVLLCDGRTSPAHGLHSLSRARAVYPEMRVVFLCPRFDSTSSPTAGRLGATMLRAPFTATELRDVLVAVSAPPSKTV